MEPVEGTTVNSSTTAERDAIVDKYRQDGFVIFRNVLDDELLREMSDHVAWLMAKYPERRPEALTQELIADDPFWVRVISDERLLDLAEIFTGPDIALFASSYFVKPPKSGLRVLWHQDTFGWPIDPKDGVVTLWVAIDRSDSENGCLRIIPGSHHMNLADQVSSGTAGVDNVLGAEIRADIDESEALDIVLDPGDVEVHHPLMVHGSNANTSARRRAGLTLRYIPTSTRIVSERQPFESALWLRGDKGDNVYIDVPVYREGEHFPFRMADAWS